MKEKRKREREKKSKKKERREKKKKREETKEKRDEKKEKRREKERWRKRKRNKKGKVKKIKKEGEGEFLTAHVSLHYQLWLRPTHLRQCLVDRGNNTPAAAAAGAQASPMVPKLGEHKPRARREGPARTRADRCPIHLGGGSTRAQSTRAGQAGWLGPWEGSSQRTAGVKQEAGATLRLCRLRLQ